MRKFGEFLEDSGIAGALALIGVAAGIMAACYALMAIWYFTWQGVLFLSRGYISEPWWSLVAMALAAVIDVMVAFGVYLLFNRFSED